MNRDADIIAQAQEHHDVIGTLLNDWMRCWDDPAHYFHSEGVHVPRGSLWSMSEEQCHILAADLVSRVERLASLLGVPGVQK